MKILAWTVLAVIILIIIGLVYYLLVGAGLFRYAFSRKSLSARVFRKDTEKRLKDYKIDLCWWDKVKFEKVSTKSFDGLSLVGHFFDAGTDKTAVILHGFGGSYHEMQPYCKFFHDKNFNVLAVDNRAHGESEGRCIGFGWLDRFDVLAWVKFLEDRNPDTKILLFGLSMGASAVLSACGERLPKNVVACIADCAFANADRQIGHVMRKHKMVFKFFRRHLYSYTKRLHGLDILQADTQRQVKNSKIPILYIHGKEDSFVPIENSKILYNATPSNLRDSFFVDDATHAMSYSVAGVIYEKKISDFLKSRTNF